MSSHKSRHMLYKVNRAKLKTSHWCTPATYLSTCHLHWFDAGQLRRFCEMQTNTSCRTSARGIREDDPIMLRGMCPSMACQLCPITKCTPSTAMNTAFGPGASRGL